MSGDTARLPGRAGQAGRINRQVCPGDRARLGKAGQGEAGRQGKGSAGQGGKEGRQEARAGQGRAGQAPKAVEPTML